MRKVEVVVGLIVAFIAVCIAEVLACGIDIINPSNFDGLIPFHIENRAGETADWLGLRAVAAVPFSDIAAIGQHIGVGRLGGVPHLHVNQVLIDSWHCLRRELLGEKSEVVDLLCECGLSLCIDLDLGGRFNLVNGAKDSKLELPLL